jgi:hypothetical protein
MQVGWARFSSSNLWHDSYLQQWRQLKPIAAARLAATRKPRVAVHHRAALRTIQWQVPVLKTSAGLQDLDTFFAIPGCFQRWTSRRKQQT